MRRLILIFLWVVPLAVYAQDVIILRNGEQIDCKITKVDTAIVYYDFYKGERKLSSYVALTDIRSYKIHEAGGFTDNTGEGFRVQESTVIIDTTQYVKETSKWTNLVTFSPRYGVNAKGWSVQYYGYNIRNTSRWAFPILFAIEGFTIDPEYFSQFNYQSAAMSYFQFGVSPFYRLNDSFFLNLGFNLVMGGETLKDFYGKESSHSFFGFSPSQGIFFIPKSKVGITLGLSVYEKLLTSQVYKSDVGLKIEIGIKF
jgi:hypothetical protein